MVGERYMRETDEIIGISSERLYREIWDDIGDLTVVALVAAAAVAQRIQPTITGDKRVKIQFAAAAAVVSIVWSLFRDQRVNLVLLLLLLFWVCKSSFPLTCRAFPCVWCFKFRMREKVREAERKIENEQDYPPSTSTMKMVENS